jgi:hypothetical protein
VTGRVSCRTMSKPHGLYLVATLLLAACGSAHAFQSDGPPPSSSVLVTTTYVVRLVIPRMRYKDATPNEAIRHLLGVADLPAPYGISVDTSHLKQADAKVITFDADNLPLLQALARIAEQTHAEIVIQPGKIILRNE